MDSSQLLPVLGVVVGATLQFFLSRVSESAKSKSALRIQAYVDYIACIADSAHARDDHYQADALLRAANAKTRISVYGSAQVITALAQFEEAGAEIRSPDQRAAFLLIISAMRAEGVGKRHDVAIESIETILFGGR